MDSINKYGKCVLSIKDDNKTYNELEIMIQDDGFNVDDDTLLVILSILYSESFIPEKYKSFLLKLMMVA